MWTISDYPAYYILSGWMNHRQKHGWFDYDSFWMQIIPIGEMVKHLDGEKH